MGYLQERRDKFRLAMGDDVKLQETPKMVVVDITCGIFSITNDNGYSLNVDIKPSSSAVSHVIGGNTKFGALYHGLGIQLQNKLRNEFFRRPLCNETINDMDLMAQTWYENAKATNIGLTALEDAVSHLTGDKK